MKIKVANVEKILSTILMLGTISYMSSFRRPTTAYPLDPMEGGGHCMAIWVMSNITITKQYFPGHILVNNVTPLHFFYQK